MKLHRRDYEDYDDLPQWQKDKVDAAIAKRARKAERRSNSTPAVQAKARAKQKEKAT